MNKQRGIHQKIEYYNKRHTSAHLHWVDMINALKSILIHEISQFKTIVRCVIQILLQS